MYLLLHDSMRTGYIYYFYFYIRPIHKNSQSLAAYQNKLCFCNLVVTQSLIHSVNILNQYEDRTKIVQVF